eukprot:298074_1
MTYNDQLPDVPKEGLGMGFWLHTHDMTFNDVNSEDYHYRLRPETGSQGKLIKSGGIYNLKISEQFSKVEVGFWEATWEATSDDSPFSKYNDRVMSKGVPSDDAELKWVTVGLNCANPQKSIPKDFKEDRHNIDKVYDCYVPENKSGVEGAFLDKVIWTRIRINMVDQVDGADVIARPHAKIAGMGSTKFGIDLFFPSTFTFET